MDISCGPTEKEVNPRVEALKKAILAWAEQREREYALYRSWWPEMLREYKENRRHQEKS